ncbi:E3 ubiquitin-protein ligase [Phytophthora boehmeriae]|uniref:E3 ubiquitin-protein ligase n=1 Tax=Phytophthora boehmeriae TaxID=109152 RepID=A0A8T1X6P0_9STRA|nr:E3 ubiquitin-protein ligase [Phytophthora boehmeriae]
MSEPVVVAPTAERRRSSSAVKSRDDIKKRVALWKKQIKCFKLKDVGKKVDAVRFCVQDDRFFREQPEVLPQLMGFLTRTKTPELVLETLSVFHSLLSPQAQPVPDAVGSADANDIIHPELNGTAGLIRKAPCMLSDCLSSAGFMVERSTSADSGWKAGEPFINLFSASALSPDIRVRWVSEELR